MNPEYDFKSIEAKWQNYWESNKTFKADDFSDKPKYYCLDMFPLLRKTGLLAYNALRCGTPCGTS